jgi:hypothetical protein
LEIVMICVYVGLGLVVATMLLYIWLRLRAGRAAKKRDDRLFAELRPIMERIMEKKPVNAEEVGALATRPELRMFLYAALKVLGQLDLFPEPYLMPVAQAEAVLAHWMMHPNEDGEAPEQMQLEERIQRELEGEKVEYFVFRYKMRAGHWRAKEGWLLGLAFISEETPYEGKRGAFTRGDKVGTITPHALVDWFTGVVDRKQVTPGIMRVKS